MSFPDIELLVYAYQLNQFGEYDKLKIIIKSIFWVEITAIFYTYVKCDIDYIDIDDALWRHAKTGVSLIIHFFLYFIIELHKSAFIEHLNFNLDMLI